MSAFWGGRIRHGGSARVNYATTGSANWWGHCNREAKLRHIMETYDDPFKAARVLGCIVDQVRAWWNVVRSR